MYQNSLESFVAAYKKTCFITESVDLITWYCNLLQFYICILSDIKCIFLCGQYKWILKKSKICSQRCIYDVQYKPTPPSHVELR